jgi:hypothetical protein
VVEADSLRVRFRGFVFGVRVPCPAGLERGGRGGGRLAAEAVRRGSAAGWAGLDGWWADDWRGGTRFVGLGRAGEDGGGGRQAVSAAARQPSARVGGGGGGGGRSSGKKEVRVAGWEAAVEGGRSAWRRGSHRPGLVEEAAGVVAGGGGVRGSSRSLVGCGGLEVCMVIHLREAI